MHFEEIVRGKTRHLCAGPLPEKMPFSQRNKATKVCSPEFFYVEGNNPAFSYKDLSCILFSGFGMKAVVDYGDGCHLHRLQLWASLRSVG
jgi:hypothetical protein